MTWHDRSFVEGAPLIARVAGLSAEIVERFSTGLCAELQALRGAEEERLAAREAMVDRVHTAVPTAPPELRRFLLNVKRDCFNGRSLERHLKSAQWAVLRNIAGPAADRLATAEEEATARSAAFDERFFRERDRQRHLLEEQLDNPAFVRGLAMANPQISWITHRLRDRAGYGHGKKKAEITLLRYVSRAAVKLSPFSTLTSLALATLRSDLAPAVPRLVGSDWRARSLVRIKPYLLDQYAEMLRRYPPLRDRLPVVLNSSATESVPGRFIFLRPSHWIHDEAAGRLGYREQSLVQVGLKGPLVTRLQEILIGTQPGYRELVSMLEREFGARGTAEQVAGQIDQLLRIGFLHLVLPWSGHEMHMEKRMLHHLRSFPLDDALVPFTERLERLVQLEDGYAAAEDPTESLQDIERLTAELWRAAAPLGGLDPETGYGRASIHNVHEEVFLLPEVANAPPPSVVHMSEAAAEKALRSVEPLVRLASLFEHRHELLHAMESFARERWPGEDEIALMDLFQAMQPLWRDYLCFRVAAREDEGWRTTWNPRRLPEVEALDRFRGAVLEGMEECLRLEHGVQHVSGEKLAALLDRGPARYTSASGGACLFLQPASTDGTLWMLNRMKEGTGRFGSRYTPVMDSRTRAAYASHIAARGVFQLDGERVEMLDLRCVPGDNINVHACQTPAVLTFPGENPGVDAPGRVQLSDLRVVFGAGEPALRGRDGLRYVTAFLGLAYEDYVPSLVRFLCAFGPSEMSAVFPPRASRDDGLVTMSCRTVIGNVVLHRQGWSFPTRLLRNAIEKMTDTEAFAAVNRWRMDLGIPDRVFMAERSPHPIQGFRYQPQYLDFTSPLFVALLRSALEPQGDLISFTEMLPTSAMFSPDAAGRRWAVELLVDSLALRPEPASGPQPGACVRAVSPPTVAGSRFSRA
ncbi:MAG TPA: lantibiotic dehydratase [Longimicrobium sp.]|jgi:hypothetical protein|uniref:lantibiotic dehydratase n=1 Tax=Longimicrobium sp. TaxID=2029185 RepID=UPI002EDAA5B6